MELSEHLMIASLAHPLPKGTAQLHEKKCHGRLTRRDFAVAIVLAAILGLGIFLRVYPSSGFERVGYDEHGYMVFLRQIEKAGVANYDTVVHVFVEDQYRRPDAVVPATRIGFLLPAYLCGRLLHCGPFEALRATSCIASILLLGLCAVFAYRLGGIKPMLGMTALFATAPLQIDLAQRALIDGYFAFWAIAATWLAWENLRERRSWGWTAAYAFSLAVLVLTKENAAFVVFALFGAMLVSPFLGLPTPSPRLLLATMLGPLLAVGFLSSMVGGPVEWVRLYQMFVAKSRTNPYSILAQDGPWFRYIVDFVLASPVVTLLAFSKMLHLKKTDRTSVFLTAFLALSFLAMASVTYGMSLRYAAYWEFPLCWLACSELLALSRNFPKVRPGLVACGLFVIVSAVGLRQYHRLFVEGAIYDPTTAAMVRALDMQK